MPSFLPTLLPLLLSSALLAHASIQQKDFTGIGHILVLASSDWTHASPTDTIGCLSDTGKLVSVKTPRGCGVFSRRSSYPYTLSSRQGNCTFDDATQQRNTDSHYGGSDYAWSCTHHAVDIYDELYTIDGFPYVFLCFGDVACYYDAKKAPGVNEALPLWPFRWGSQQMDITPGHVMVLLKWQKLGDLPKREGAEERIPGPRIEVKEGMQVALMGGRVRE